MRLRECNPVVVGFIECVALHFPFACKHTDEEGSANYLLFQDQIRDAGIKTKMRFIQFTYFWYVCNRSTQIGMQGFVAGALCISIRLDLLATLIHHIDNKNCGKLIIESLGHDVLLPAYCGPCCHKHFNFCFVVHYLFWLLCSIVDSCWCLNFFSDH